MTKARRIPLALMAWVAALSLSACRPEGNPKRTPTAGPGTPSPTSASPQSALSTNQQIYLVKGVVREVMPDQQKIKVAHEEIPDYMEAMTMVFDVKNERDLSRFKPGDAIRFRMTVTADDGWIDNLTKLEEPGQVAAPAPETFRRVREVDPLQIGALIPEYRFTNEQGRGLSLGDLKGQAVGITFIFTRCLYPTFCPRMSGNFALAQQKLQALSGGPTNWHLLSITFDPEHDTPSVLKSYAQQFKNDPAHWSFLTGDLIDITAIAEQFGMLFWRSDPTRPANIDHNLRTVVIDANGRVQKVFIENEWKVDELVSELVKAAKVPLETAATPPR